MFRNYIFKIIIFFKKKFIGFKQIHENEIKKKKYNLAYQNKDLIELILLKNKEFRKKKNNFILEDKNLFSGMFRIKKKIKVLDLGGGGGHTFLTFKKNYPFKNILWYNYETPALVKLFKKHLKIENKLTFTHNLEEIPEKIDLLYSNGSLHYIQDQPDLINKILKKKINYIYIKRTFFNQKNFKTISAMQQSLLSENGPGSIQKKLFNDRIIKYPLYILSKEKFEKLIKKKFFLIYKKKDDRDFIIINGIKYFSFVYLFKSKIIS